MGLSFFTNEDKCEHVISDCDRNIFPLCYYKKLKFHLVNSSQMKLARACWLMCSSWLDKWDDKLIGVGKVGSRPNPQPHRPSLPNGLMSSPSLLKFYFMWIGFNILRVIHYVWIMQRTYLRARTPQYIVPLSQREKLRHFPYAGTTDHIQPNTTQSIPSATSTRLENVNG